MAAHVFNNLGEIPNPPSQRQELLWRVQRRTRRATPGPSFFFFFFVSLSLNAIDWLSRDWSLSLRDS
jgi:hypothetical protein